jgi:hypothetical protein
VYDKAGNSNSDERSILKMPDFNFIRKHPLITLGVIVGTGLLLNKLRTEKETTGPEYKAPEADAGGPYEGYVNQAITFDGSGSTAALGRTISSYSWNFGDGTTGTGEKPVHTYNIDGEFTVTLTVTDNAGASNTDTTTVKITKSSSEEGGTGGSAEEGSLFWYIVGGLGLALLASLVVLLTRRRFYV